MSPVPPRLLGRRIANTIADEKLAAVDLDGPAALVAIAKVDIERTESSEVGRPPDPGRRYIDQRGQQSVQAQCMLSHGVRICPAGIAKRAGVSPAHLIARRLTPAVDLTDSSKVASYDRLDWHYDSAVAAGQPPEHAFTHIGFYLAWIITHDLHNPSVFPASHVTAVKLGEMTGSDLSDDIDTKLVPDDMNAEGRAFSDARYAAYLAEYEAVFADLPDYAVSDDPADYARIAPVIDSLYAAWVSDGRPKAPAEVTLAGPVPEAAAGFEASIDLSDEQLVSGFIKKFGGLADEPETEAMSRFATDLEALIPMDLTEPALRVHSVRASTWGSSLLKRALRQLGVDPKDATVVVAMGGRGRRVLTVILYGIPGVIADRLLAEVESAITLPPRGRWSDREVAGRMVRWATGREFTVAFWARDGLIIHVAGSAEDVEQAVSLLP